MSMSIKVFQYYAPNFKFSILKNVTNSAILSKDKITRRILCLLSILLYS